jgi:hypothetical protein
MTIQINLTQKYVNNKKLACCILLIQYIKNTVYGWEYSLKNAKIVKMRMLYLITNNKRLVQYHTLAVLFLLLLLFVFHLKKKIYASTKYL